MEVNSLHKIKIILLNFVQVKIIQTYELLNIKAKFKHCEYFAKPSKIGLANTTIKIIIIGI